MGNQPNETLELIIKCDTIKTKSDMRQTKCDTKQFRHWNWNLKGTQYRQNVTLNKLENQVETEMGQKQTMGQWSSWN